MKVTVCFRDVKVVVPCGDGNGLVRDLLEEAIARYKKVLSKTVDNNWITDKTVKLLLSDGGILDLDDKIVDVIDDKEQIQAIIDGNHPMLDGHSDNNGDGMSGSSLGTSSPDIFRDNITERICSGKESSDLQVDDQHDIIITEQDFQNESGLRVRRGSEPALCSSVNSVLDSSKGANATGVVPGEFPIYGAVCKGPNSRKDPLGSTSTSGLKNGHYLVSTGKVTGESPPVSGTNVKTASSEKEQTEKQESELIIVLPKSSEALGIHVVPEFDSTNRNVGLLIEKVEPGGRADRDGRLHQHDKITEINFQNLFGVEFSKAQDIFRSAFLAPELQIKLRRRVDPPEMTSGHSAKFPLAEENGRIGAVKATDAVQSNGADSPRKIPPAVPARNPKTQLSSKPTSRLTMQTISIELVKGAQGLGFSVTTRGVLDNDYCPIYVKSIFDEGAAVEDGRLKPGDVLLEINGISLVNKSKAEAVRMLRRSPRGSKIELLVRRAGDGGPTSQQIQVNHKPAVPRPVSTLGFFPHSTSSNSDKADDDELEEDQEEEKDQEEIDTTTEDIFDNHRNGLPVSYNRNGFGSLCSNLNRVGIDEDDFSPDLPTGGKETGPASSLQKSRKSISMDDLRRNFARSTVEASFDDDVDFPVAPFNKQRDFNQSFRAAVIDKSYNEPYTNVVSRTVKYPAPVQKTEKLKMIEEKKNRSKKENERGSGRKFGWFFKFGKNKKPVDEDIRTGHLDVTDQKSKPEMSLAKNFPTPEQQKDPLSQSSHPLKYSQYQVQGRQVEGGGSQLNKEDYMITAVPQQQKAVSRDPPQGYLKSPTPRPGHHSNNQSFDDPRSQHPDAAGLARVTTGRDDYVVPHDQFYHVPPQRSLNDYSIPPTQNPYVGRTYHEALDPSPEYYRQENLPPRGGLPPRTYYQDDELVAPVRSPLGFYRQNSPQLFEAADPAWDYYRSRESQPVPQLGHYYQRENFERAGHRYKQNKNQNRHYYHPSEPYGGHDRSFDQYPLDLSKYALQPQDHGGGGAHGYRNPELSPKTRIYAPPSDLQIRNQPPNVYPPYKEVSPGVMPGANINRARELSKHSQQNSRPTYDPNEIYQARLRQNKMPLTSDRW